MRKLKLQPEDLNVDSFTTAAGPGAGGTVTGHANPYSGPGPHCTALSDPCGGTCEISCNGSCACEDTVSPSEVWSCAYTCELNCT